jgi:5-(carboxyamino)imidazole ribonucleotide synthase
LGDLWDAKDQQPDWSRILTDNVKLHLYGKHQARVGRKMGHFNYLAGQGVDTLVKAKKSFLMLSAE